MARITIHVENLPEDDKKVFEDIRKRVEDAGFNGRSIGNEIVVDFDALSSAGLKALLAKALATMMTLAAETYNGDNHETGHALN